MGLLAKEGINIPKQRILVVSPHPDDDVLGMGGTIRKAVDEGNLVHVLYLTSGELGCPGKNTDEVIEIREREANKCSDLLGIATRTFFHIPDGQVKNDHETQRRLLEIWSELKIELIYAPHVMESHPDHKAAGELVTSTMQGRIPVRFYEVWTPLSRPNVVTDISNYMTRKRAAVRCHESQVVRNPFVEAILALNNYRGLMNGPNVMYAEVFQEGQP